MKHVGLSKNEIELICSTFSKFSAIERVMLFGSRAKGTSKVNSDIDLAISGVIDVLTVEKIAFELEELPLPYKFDVKLLNGIKNQSLLDHISRVGVLLYERK